MKKGIHSVAFLGGAAIPPSDSTYTNASQIARDLAQMGLTIYNGGDRAS